MGHRFNHLVFCDCTRQFTEVRSRYVKPIKHSPISPYEEIEEDDVPLTYESRTRFEDIELGSTSQFGSQRPEWLQSLQSAQNDMENIKIFMQELNILHESHTTFKVKQNASEEERKIEIQTQEIKRVCQKTNSNPVALRFM
jgi:hypothetical protein